jgi:hypothetical protein
MNGDVCFPGEHNFNGEFCTKCRYDRSFVMQTSPGALSTIRALGVMGVRRYKCAEFEVEFKDTPQPQVAQPAPELKDQMPSDEEMLGYSSPIKFIPKEG